MSLTAKFFFIVWIASLQSVGITGLGVVVQPVISDFIMDMYKIPLTKILADCPQKPYSFVMFLETYIKTFKNTENQLIENIRKSNKVDWDTFSKSSSCLLDSKFDENYFTEHLISIATKCFEQTKQGIVEEDKKAAKDKFHHRVCSAIQRGVQQEVSESGLEDANVKRKE